MFCDSSIRYSSTRKMNISFHFLILTRKPWPISFFSPSRVFQTLLFTFLWHQLICFHFCPGNDDITDLKSTRTRSSCIFRFFYSGRNIVLSLSIRYRCLGCDPDFHSNLMPRYRVTHPFAY